VGGRAPAEVNLGNPIGLPTKKVGPATDHGEFVLCASQVACHPSSVVHGKINSRHDGREG